MKYVAVIGGGISGVGKGIASSSLGVLLQAAGLHVTHIKIDPYLNADAGTMAPSEHGETYVLDDGGEVDLDLGNYERFLQRITLTKDHNLTTGKLNECLHLAERAGLYLGKTVQVIPHQRDMVEQWIERVAAKPVESDGKTPDVCVIELGGTIGDLESKIYLEALKHMRHRMGHTNVAIVHVTPVLVHNGEQKTKPAQGTLREMNNAGLAPDLVFCRCDVPVLPKTIQKMAEASMVHVSRFLSVHNCANLYGVPELLHSQHADKILLEQLHIQKTVNLDAWIVLRKHMEVAFPQKANLGAVVNIALVGKYNSTDAYLSVHHALQHAAAHFGVPVSIQFVDAERLEFIEDNDSKDNDTDAEYKKQFPPALTTCDGIVIPGGFDSRGTEGLIRVCQFALRCRIPILGICLGFQTMVINQMRKTCPNANSMEFDKTTDTPVIIPMPDVNQTLKGGTMRLGAKPTLLSPRSLLYSHYVGETTNHHQTTCPTLTIQERHRHRYEVNPKYIEQLTSSGMEFVGTGQSHAQEPLGETTNPDEKHKEKPMPRMEIAEVCSPMQHPFYVGVQFHPEFKSRPFQPSPPFLGLIEACLQKAKIDSKESSKTKEKDRSMLSTLCAGLSSSLAPAVSHTK